jgi:endonuclease/exonuclease/phosphatase family metal-dependent hydrolase
MLERSSFQLPFCVTKSGVTQHEEECQPTHSRFGTLCSNLMYFLTSWTILAVSTGVAFFKSLSEVSESPPNNSVSTTPIPSVSTPIFPVSKTFDLSIPSPVSAPTSTILKRKMISNFPASHNHNNEATFSVLQMNTLAAGLCNKESFPFSDPSVLDWSFRSQHLLSVLTEHHHDVICLQEVDRYADYFEKGLALHGYKGLWKQKVPPSPAPDGCAFFYKKSRFELVDVQKVEFNPHQPQVAILAKLRLRETEEEKKVRLQKFGEEAPGVLVATTHLKAKAGFEERRREQGAILLQKIKEFAGNSELNEGGWPLVVCGDFNDVPGSKVIELFDYGLNGSPLSRRCHSTPVLTQEETTNRVRSYLKSVYEREVYTTYKSRGSVSQKCIDYIFFDPARLEL